jgi:hypothetical protein
MVDGRWIVGQGSGMRALHEGSSSGKVEEEERVGRERMKDGLYY